MTVRTVTITKPTVPLSAGSSRKKVVRLALRNRTAVSNSPETPNTTSFSIQPVSSPSPTSPAVNEDVCPLQQLPRLVADTTQLKHALEAFEYAHVRVSGWAHKYYDYLIEAGIDSMNALLAGCREDTLNLDLDFIGVCPNDRLDSATVGALQNFLPGPVGIRCFRLAQMAAEKVRRGEADVKYVHRPENGKAGAELWHVIPHATHHLVNTPSPDNSMMIVDSSDAKQQETEEPPRAPQWTLHVDCAGFVRSVLKHITKDVVQVSLSDRSFMRAKDFYRFFETLDRTVFDREIDNPFLTAQQPRILKWRLITDLRMVIPGDIIVYRPKGNAAAGAAFTTNDRSDLKHLLKAVKVALLYHEEMELNGPKHLVTRNLGRDPEVKPFVDAERAALDACGIQSCSQLRNHLRKNKLNELRSRHGFTAYDALTLKLMQECAETTAKNTGHIVFAAGPAVLMDPDTNEYRVKVVHSTKNGVNRTEGVQQYFRRFQLIEGPNGPQWTRKVPAVSSGRNATIAVTNPSSEPLPSNNSTTKTKKQKQNTIVQTTHIIRDDDEDSQQSSSLPSPTVTTNHKRKSSSRSSNALGNSNTTDTSSTNTRDKASTIETEDMGDDEDNDEDGDDPEDQEINIKNANDEPEDDEAHGNTNTSTLKSSIVANVVEDNNEGNHESVQTLDVDELLMLELLNEGVGNEHNDELAGLSNVEVLAARMCF